MTTLSVCVSSVYYVAIKALKQQSVYWSA